MARKKEINYLAWAAENGGTPKGSNSYRRYLVYGRNKKGKTRFALSNGRESTIVLDPEKGTDSMMKVNPYRLPITRWTDLSKILGALRTGELSPAHIEKGGSKEPFTWVSVDGLTKINHYALRYIMSQEERRDLDRRPGIIDRRDYNKSGELMKELVNQFHALPMNVCFTAQERMEAIDTGDADEEEESVFFVPDLPKGCRAVVNQVVEVIGRIYTVRVEIKGKEKVQRRLQIGPHERYDTGFRSDFGDQLPQFIRWPSIPKLTKLILEGEV